MSFISSRIVINWYNPKLYGILGCQWMIWATVMIMASSGIQVDSSVCFPDLLGDIHEPNLSCSNPSFSCKLCVCRWCCLASWYWSWPTLARLLLWIPLSEIHDLFALSIFVATLYITTLASMPGTSTPSQSMNTSLLCHQIQARMLLISRLSYVKNRKQIW